MRASTPTLFIPHHTGIVRLKRARECGEVEDSFERVERKGEGENIFSDYASDKSVGSFERHVRCDLVQPVAQMNQEGVNVFGSLSSGSNELCPEDFRISADGEGFNLCVGWRRDKPCCVKMSASRNGSRCTFDGNQYSHETCREESGMGTIGESIAHGSGRRCDEEGCKKRSRDTNGKCTAHGGGRRCDEPG